jgi:hypothetical protein
MKNLWANSAMGLGIGLIITGVILIVMVPLLGISVGSILLFLGIMGLRQLKKDPTVGGKPQSIIGISIGILMILVSLYWLIFSTI